MQSLLANWKLLVAGGSLLLSGAGIAYSHTSEANERFQTIEYEVRANDEQLDRIEDDVDQIRCMIVQSANGDNPLDCIEVNR